MTKGQVLNLNGHRFEVTDRVEKGYQIWNIGRNMPDGYLPLCRLKKDQPFDGGRYIESDTLKCIPMEGAQVILAAVGYGAQTPDEMRRYIAKYRAGTSSWRRHASEKMGRALPYMDKIVWE